MSRSPRESRFFSAVVPGQGAEGASPSGDEWIEKLEQVAEALERGQAERETLARRLQWSLSEQGRLESRLSRVENSLIFRLMRSVGTLFTTNKLKLGHTLLRTPVHSLYLKLTPWLNRDRTYENWVARQETREHSWEWHRDRATRWLRRPLVSIVMATHNPRREWLEDAVKSVLGQSYPFWELCLCDDHSPSWVAEYLESLAAADSRIHWCASDEPSGVARTLNRAGTLTRGEYVGFLDHDDVLSPFALHYVVESMQEAPVDVIYTDEDHIDPSGRRVRPSFKPDWSPDLLTTCMYWGHFLVVARERMEQAAWFRSEYDGAQDYDLALRLTDAPARVRHVPQVLYHWRQHLQSTALTASAKRYTHEAGRGALQDMIRRRGWDAQLADGPIPNSYYVRRKVETGRISIIICSRSGRLLGRCLRALDRTLAGYNSQVVVVHHETGAGDGVDRVLRERNCVTVPYRESFNFARMNNLGVAASHGDYLFFLNDDVLPLAADWADHMLAHLQRPGVGVVGAKLVYPSGAIQHAGIVLGMGDGTGHPGRGVFQDDLWRWLDYTRNVSAVTGACLGIRRGVFLELEGFDTDLPVNYNDVDLCLRARRAGYEVICEPHARLRHYECQTRTPGTSLYERERLHDRWAEVLDRPDPYFNIQLARDSEKTRLA